MHLARYSRLLASARPFLSVPKRNLRTMSDPPPIAVIGAGVIGLTTALRLLDLYPYNQNSTSTPASTPSFDNLTKPKLYLIASELPTDPTPSADYASMWAGAHYRPIAGSSTQLRAEAKLAQRTADVMLRIARERPEWGVRAYPAREYIEEPGEELLALKTGNVYAGDGDGFRVMEKEELPQGVKWGCEYDTYCVNVPVYLRAMLKSLEGWGVVLVRRKLKDAQEVFDIMKDDFGVDVQTVVNCSGRNFDSDPSMKIIRGQTVLVRQPYHATVTRQHRDGSWTFLIPRPEGGTIVGGTKEIGDVESQARPESTRHLLESAVKCFPDFVQDVEDFDIMKINVGRRPWREGGTRLEAETLSGVRHVVHGYGLGGRGYELSHGVADQVCTLVNSMHLRQT